MASNGDDDIDEFVTCGVCLWEYDEEIRKPKFLPCSHTVCLLCLQGIVQGTTIKSITCPFCRHVASKDTSSCCKWVLPNNTYALQMLKLNKQSSDPDPMDVMYPQMKNKNVNALLKLKEELLEIRDTGISKLALAIQKRKKVQEEMAVIIEAIDVAGEEAKKFQEENDLSLAEMVSVLEENELDINPETDSENGKKRDMVLSELMSLVEGSTPSDSVDTLKEKMTESFEVYEQKLNEATAIASEYELCQKTKIQVHLFDENDRPISTHPILKSGFRFQPISPSLNGPLCQQDAKFLSHAVFWFLERQKNSMNEANPSTVCDSKSSSVVTTHCPSAAVVSTLDALPTSLPPRLPSNSKRFVMGQSSIFILKLYKSGTFQGEIHIRPLPAFHPEFVRQLGEFCFESPKNFGSYIDKAIPGVFISFSLTTDHHPGFHPVVPSMFDSKSRKTGIADANTTIGVAMVENELGYKVVTGWNFIIPLKDWHNPKCAVAHSVSNNELFGHIIRCTTKGAVTIMSQSSKSERGSYSLTIESAMKSALKS